MRTANKINNENADIMKFFESTNNSCTSKERYHALRRTPRSELTWYEKGYEDALTKIYDEQREEQESQIKSEIQLKLLNERTECAMLRNYVCNLVSTQTDLSQEQKDMIRGAMSYRIANINEQLNELKKG